MKKLHRKGRNQRRKAWKIRAAENKSVLNICSQGQVELTAAEGEESKPRFTMVAYSGAKMRPGGWYEEEPLVLDLKGMQVASTIPVHRDHSTEKIIGHSEAVTVKGGKLQISGRVSAENEHAREVVGSSKNEFPWQASVGASLSKEPELVQANETVVVNGRRMAGPMRIARKWVLKEASFVSLGADSRTSGVAAGAISMNEFEKWLVAKGFELESLTDAQETSLKATFDAEVAAKAPPKEDPPKKDPPKKEDLPKKDIEASDDDEDQLKGLVKARSDFYARVAKVDELLGDKPELAAKAIEENWSEDKINLELLRASYSKGPAIHGGSTGKPIRQDAIEARMLMNDGMSEEYVVKQYGEKAVEASRNLPSSAGIHFLLHETIRAAGGTSHPGTMDNEVIRAAFAADRQLQAASGFSTISLSGTLSNLANKSLLRAYNETPSVFRSFSRTTSHNDFKNHTKYRVTTPGLLEELGPTGEIKHTELDEDTYANQVTTFARMMALTRTMMINDDLNAFLQIPSMFGRMAARTLERSVFTTLMDNTGSFFNATATVAANGHLPNALAAGGSSALSAAALGSAETLFWNQVDKHSNPIDLIPSLLLVAPAKYRDAVNLVNQTTVNVVGDPTSGEQLRVGNEYAGAFNPTKSPYVSAAGIAGSSATQWWLFASPSADIAAIEVAFLRGRQNPVIENAESDFNTLGMQWRAYHDWGVAKQDPRAAVWSPGA